MKLLKFLLVPALLIASAAAQAGIAIIVHPSNTNVVDRNDISHIFLGKTKAFPDGTKAAPVDQAEDSLVRAAFNQHVLKKSPNKLRKYWAQMMFTGQGTPPKELASDDAVKSHVASNPEAIAYIEDANVDDSVHVVFIF